MLEVGSDVTLSNSEDTLDATGLTLKRANMVNLLHILPQESLFNAENENFT